MQMDHKELTYRSNYTSNHFDTVMALLAHPDNFHTGMFKDQAELLKTFLTELREYDKYLTTKLKGLQGVVKTRGKLDAQK